MRGSKGQGVQGSRVRGPEGERVGACRHAPAARHGRRLVPFTQFPTLEATQGQIVNQHPTDAISGR